MLKTSYNTAWGFFNSTKLGDTITGYMQSWLNRAECMEFNLEFPPSPEDWKDDVDSMLSGIIRCHSSLSNKIFIPNLRSTGILNHQTIVSCKCTFNLSDTIGLWKHIMLEKQDE